MSYQASNLLDAIAEWQWAGLKKLAEESKLLDICREKANLIIQLRGELI
jgi:hypothetical protein